MALFLRGNVWWMEYRTRKVRKVLSTGLRKNDVAKAKDVWNAFRLAMGARPNKSAVERIIGEIYSDRRDERLMLSSVYTVYGDWAAGKGRKVSVMTETNRRNLMVRFVDWAKERGVVAAEDVTVFVARDFVAHLRKSGKSNKTIRTYSQYLSSIWKAVSQMVGKLDNPWLAACPDPDGSSCRRSAFTIEQEVAVLKAARSFGHDWHLASLIARWTGLRYGDVARLDWSQVDLKSRTISVVPSKTRKHDVVVTLPVAEPLYKALKAVKDREGFVLPEHAMIYPAPMSPAFSEVLASCNLDTRKFTFHSWRHTFRTRMGEAGVSEDVARRLGGWTNLKMAAHYDHASHLTEMREAIGRMTTGG